ncbi:unnamed protein product [Fraxinus pennsylvanica]|uniref:RRM domain-containing protein n=1 Tax=Fraxinus pennsylvanica TaxID=56036 RepID=A0AAD1ZFU1_9LAMI|nr:unnamed protein product [Fraxinus pennsylvanica]
MDRLRLANRRLTVPLSLSSSNGSSLFQRLYDPFGDPKVIGCTLFVGSLSHLTTEDTLRQAMSKYGRVKNLRLVRHIVTGALRGYGFVEFERERKMRRAYKDAHHTVLDDSEIIVDYDRQQLMSG